MGRVSFFLADAARRAGAVVQTGMPVAQILPGEGVVLESGERIEAPVVISNADPRVTLALLGNAADSAWREQVEAVPIEGCTLKINVWLRELPNFNARPGLCEPHHFGQLNTPLTKQEWKQGYAAARQGRLPEHLWTRALFPKRPRPERRSCGHSHHERFLPVRAVQILERLLGRPSRRGQATRLRRPRPLLPQHRQMPSLMRKRSGRPISKRKSASPAATFSGRMPAAIHVEQPPALPHAHARPLSLRSLHASRRQRHRNEWPQRRHERSGRSLAPATTRIVITNAGTRYTTDPGTHMINPANI